MTEKERNNAAKEAYKAIREAEMKVFEMRGEAEDKVKLLFSVCDDEDKSVNIRAIFKAKSLLEKMCGAWRVISSLSPIVERLRFDGETDQFEELLEMAGLLVCLYALMQNAAERPVASPAVPGRAGRDHVSP